MKQGGIPELLSLRAAARLVGTDWRTLRTWARTGDVPGLAVEINGRLHIRRAVLEQLVRGPVTGSRV